jgi:hypothetical protein
MKQQGARYNTCALSLFLGNFVISCSGFRVCISPGLSQFHRPHRSLWPISNRRETVVRGFIQESSRPPFGLLNLARMREDASYASDDVSQEASESNSNQREEAQSVSLVSGTVPNLGQGTSFFHAQIRNDGAQLSGVHVRGLPFVLYMDAKPHVLM